jgi:hypothetical protein
MRYVIPIIVVLIVFAAAYTLGFVHGLKRGGRWSDE